MKSLIMDKLYKRVEERGVVCLGLDTAVEYIPEHVLEGKTTEEAIFEYNKAIIDETLDVVACYKVQIAYYAQPAPWQAPARCAAMRRR